MTVDITQVHTHINIPIVQDEGFFDPVCRQSVQKLLGVELFTSSQRFRPCFSVALDSEQVSSRFFSSQASERQYLPIEW